MKVLGTITYTGTPKCRDCQIRHNAGVQVISVAKSLRRQAMMELGAVACTSAPKCGECSIRAHCRAYADVQRHIAGGGAAVDAPPVAQYPAKVGCMLGHLSQIHCHLSTDLWCYEQFCCSMAGSVAQPGKDRC